MWASMLRRLVLVLYCTSLRLGEAVRLKMADIDLERGTLTIRDSKRRTRIVPMRDDLVEELRRYIDDRHQLLIDQRSVDLAELEAWMRGERTRLSRHAPAAQAIDYMLKRWNDFVRFLQDGRVCLTNNAAERALRGLALGRKAWLFAGSERGADRAAFMYTLLGTAKLNDVDPQAWLADVLARIANTPQSQLAELLPWNWKAQSARLVA